MSTSSNWDWARDVHRRALSPVVRAGYRLERVDMDHYWKVHEEHMREHFPPEVSFDTSKLRSPEQIAGQERLAAARGDDPLRDFHLVWKDGELAAQFSGEQKSPTTYRMWHSNVHPDFRRRGLYRMLVRATIEYTRELGFDTICSEHAPGNTAILIAKLKAGFRISGFDVTPDYGTSVLLTYFHSADLLAAYEFRCGLATLNRRVAASVRATSLQVKPDLE